MKFCCVCFLLMKCVVSISRFFICIVSMKCEFCCWEIFWLMKWLVC